ncbi:MAG: RdgB/HAM1 family non-canonical purine NTP pyrophosphatase [Oscillospiraceae bacterium]|nr:RdgB/HAM1 family non-canonical purine NTP pyrophosphatase [Oscillospiraceae bacterium]
MDMVIATHNAKKRAELARILQPLGHNILDIALPDVDETGNTFVQNARLKAEAGCAASGFPCIADDSGLCVDALNGAPGVYSARYAGEHGNDAANNAKILAELHSKNERSARFVCVICCVFPDGLELVAEGACEGSIGHELLGEGGFGYDPLFWPAEALGLTMAQLGAKQKDSISHRGRALEKFASKLEGILAK